MTTGRINQITIVRRGETATGAASSAGEMSSSLGGVRGRAGRSTCGLGPWVPRAGNPLSHSCVPQRCRRPHVARSGQCGLGTPGEGLSARLQPLRRPADVVAFRCSMKNSPEASNPQNPSLRRRLPEHSSPSGHPQYAVKPERPVSWGPTYAVNPSLTRPEPASLFKGPRNESLQDMVRSAVRPVGCPTVPPALTYPPSTLVGRPRHPTLVGHF